MFNWLYILWFTYICKKTISHQVHICGPSYHHHQSARMDLHPLFRVRSWNNGINYIFYYILMVQMYKVMTWFSVQVDVIPDICDILLTILNHVIWIGKQICLNLCGDLSLFGTRHHGIKTLSTLLALCEGNPLVTSGFPSQRVSNAGLWCFHWSEQAIGQIVKFWLIWETMTLQSPSSGECMTLMWNYCNGERTSAASVMTEFVSCDGMGPKHECQLSLPWPWWPHHHRQ